MSDPILSERDGDVLILTLHRPEAINALDATLRAALLAALAEADARCVVVTGAGRAFCAGQDLREGVDEPERTLREEYEPILHAIHACPAPVLAAVGGVAAGAGLSLALACDIVVAAESASLGAGFARLGLLPDMGATWALPRAVGLPRAMGLALLADPIPARRAADWGLIWEAVPDDAFDARWRETAHRLAAGSRDALRATRAALRAAFEAGLAAQLGVEAEAQGRLARAPDFAEGLAAFRDRRPPRF